MPFSTEQLRLGSESQCKPILSKNKKHVYFILRLVCTIFLRKIGGSSGKQENKQAYFWFFAHLALSLWSKTNKRTIMAKKATAKPKIEKSIETQLWESANKLRGNIEASEYKHVVLSLIFLKYAGVRFERQYSKLKEQYGDMAETVCNMPVSYAKDNVFYLPEECRWSYIMENAKQPNIPQIIDKALSDIEKSNKQLTGAMPVNYYSQVGIDPAKLGSLIDTINDMEKHMDDSNDFFGRVYEYCLSNFALQEGKGKGEYYTPKAIVNLITEMIEPYKGKVYDPACGSGGMFVQSSKFIEAHGGNRRDISVYGQEYTLTTYKLAKMNLAIRGISANLGEKAASTFQDDQHKAEKFDFIMANPPFNQRLARAERTARRPTLEWLQDTANQQCQLRLDTQYLQQALHQRHRRLLARQRRPQWRRRRESHS